MCLTQKPHSFLYITNNTRFQCLCLKKKPLSSFSSLFSPIHSTQTSSYLHSCSLYPSKPGFNITSNAFLNIFLDIENHPTFLPQWRRWPGRLVFFMSHNSDLTELCHYHLKTCQIRKRQSFLYKIPLSLSSQVWPHTWSTSLGTVDSRGSFLQGY